MLHLLSQLAHVELLTPKPSETVAFFEQQLGLEISGREGQSVYMRGWGEFFYNSIKVTESARPGLGHIGWRSDGPEELQLVARNLGATPFGQGWINGDLGHGPAYRFLSPNGHLNEVFWEVNLWQAPPELRTSLINRPQRYTGRGAAVRRIDHITVSATDVQMGREFYMKNLQFKYREGAVIDGTETETIAAISVTHKSHDLGIVLDPVPGAFGRLNHIAFWVDSHDDVHRVADLLRDDPTNPLELAPSRHGATEGYAIYFREPGGNRIEITTGGTETLAPDAKPVIWLTSQHPTFAWGGDMPSSMYTYATPPIEVSASIS